MTQDSLRKPQDDIIDRLFQHTQTHTETGLRVRGNSNIIKCFADKIITPWCGRGSIAALFWSLFASWPACFIVPRPGAGMVAAWTGDGNGRSSDTIDFGNVRWLSPLVAWESWSFPKPSPSRTDDLIRALLYRNRFYCFRFERGSAGR